jgi:hypothetical protein
MVGGEGGKGKVVMVAMVVLAEEVEVEAEVEGWIPVCVLVLVGVVTGRYYALP